MIMIHCILIISSFFFLTTGLEFLAGIPDEKLVECHGHFRTAACIDCKKAADGDQVKETIVQLGETPICNYCAGNVKPDIGTFVNL